MARHPLIAESSGGVSSRHSVWGYARAAADCGKRDDSDRCPQRLLHGRRPIVSAPIPSLSIYFLTFHSLNNRAADNVCRKLAFEGHKPFLIDWWRSVGMGTGDVLDDQEWGTGHGGEMITSVLLHVAPEAVSMEEETNREPKKQFGYYRDHLSWTSSPFAAYTTFADYCEGSSWGVLDNATAEKGEILVKRAVEAISSFIKNSPAQ